jgi:hypothetical protein
MTWGELRKCRALSRSSERLGAKTGVGVDDGDEESLVDGGSSVETGLDEPATGCELSSLLEVIKRAVSGAVVHHVLIWFSLLYRDYTNLLTTLYGKTGLSVYCCIRGRATTDP